MDNGQTQTFNSLFIWYKDKVIRVVFSYDRKFAVLSKYAVSHLKSFESFIPTFKTCTWHENPKYKLKRSIPAGISIYDNTFTDGYEDDTRADYFTAKFRILVNARNEKYNPLADKFGSIAVSDGNPEVMIYNYRRKGKKINNLPLLISSANKDSSFIINPLKIYVYRLDNSLKNNNVFLRNLTGYQLYATISFLQQVKIYPTGKDFQENYEWGDYFTEKYPLPYLYKINSPVDTTTLMRELAEQPLSNKRIYSDNYIMAEPKIYHRGILSKKDSIRIVNFQIKLREDSLKRVEANKLKFFRGDRFDYQYCAECYNNETSTKEKINKHCPFKVALYKNRYDENWSYAFTDECNPYFKVEYRNYETINSIKDNSELLNSYKWLLMSPGVGYWISDVSNYYSQYSINGFDLFLNGKKIVE